MVNSIGLIDKGYIGNIKAPFLNTSSTTTFHLKKGDRYVQLVNGDLSDVHFKIVTKHRETSGSDGFGSTGFNIDSFDFEYSELQLRVKNQIIRLIIQ